jgi:hypothetical protein
MAPLPDIVTVLQDNPEAIALLTVVVRAVMVYQRQATWSEYRAIHRFKRGVFPLVYSVTRGALHLVNDKGGRDDAEFVATTDATVREVVKAFKADGASLHLLNSIKRRPDEHGDPLSAAHLIYTVGDDQVEVYLFRNSDGSTDLYAHTEASVEDPMAHLTERQRDGDRHDVIPDAYTES